jgi:hypothetical protein
MFDRRTIDTIFFIMLDPTNCQGWILGSKFDEEDHMSSCDTRLTFLIRARIMQCSTS